MQRMAWVGFLLVGPKEEACHCGAVVAVGGPLALERELRAQTRERVVRLDGFTDVVELFGEILGTASLDVPETQGTPLGAFVGAAEKIVVSNDATVLWVTPEAADSLSAQLVQLGRRLFEHDDTWLPSVVESSAEEQESRAHVEEVAEVYDRGGASGVGVVVCLLRCDGGHVAAREGEHAYASVKPDTGTRRRGAISSSRRRKLEGKV